MTDASSMPAARPGANEALIDEAVEWLVRVEAKDASDADFDAFAEWLAANPDHANAYEHADRYWQGLARVDRGKLEAFQRRRAAGAAASGSASPLRLKDRTGGWLTALASAAAVILVVLFGVVDPLGRDSVEPERLVYQSAKGEVRTIELEDGSRVTLGADTTLIVALQHDTRAVELQTGEAFFDVAPNPASPFDVRSGELRVRVTGTQFDVQRKGSFAQVAVAEGAVDVSLATAANGPDRNATTTLESGQRVVVHRSGEAGKVSGFDPAQVGAWRQNRLFYEDVPLEAIIADLNRYRAQEIRVADRRAADILVSASFDSRDIDAVLVSLAELFALEVVRDDAGGTTLRSRR